MQESKKNTDTIESLHNKICEIKKIGLPHGWRPFAINSTGLTGSTIDNVMGLKYKKKGIKTVKSVIESISVYVEKKGLKTAKDCKKIVDIINA